MWEENSPIARDSVLLRFKNTRATPSESIDRLKERRSRHASLPAEDIMYQNQRKVSKNYRGKNPSKKQKRDKKLPVCPVCGKPIKMLPYDEMDFRFVDKKKHPDFYWACSDYPQCDTYVGADSKGRPAGTLAGPRLRAHRRFIHEWENFMAEEMRTDKKAFRSMCAYQLGIMNPETYHTATLNDTQCETILNYLKGMYEKDKKVQQLIDTKYFHTSVWKHVHGLDKEKNAGAHYDRDGNIYRIGRWPTTEEKMAQAAAENAAKVETANAEISG